MTVDDTRQPRGIRVAVVIPTHWDFRMGGSQYQAKLLIEQLHEKHAASVTYFAARAHENRDYIDHKVVRVGHANAFRRFGHFWDFFRLQKALRDFAPDVIYQRVGCAYTGIAALYAERYGIPLIWHLASQSDCQNAPPARQLLGRPHALIETRLAAKGVSGANLVIAQSRDQLDMLLENYGRHADRVIGNFHSVPAASDKQTDRFTVIWIANLKAVKRPELYFEIAAQLADMKDIDILMVGQAYSSAAKKRDFDQALQTHPNVEFLGALPNDEVNHLLERSHLLVNTSRSEGFSNTFIQAWMRSVPVLTMGVNPDGLLADSFLGRCHSSTTEIANSIRELVGSIAMLKDMGEQSRQYAVRHFSMSNATELADLVVQTALDNRDNPRKTSKN
jgi:glycosyltransferase involved in cell wall biosynthesis